MPSLMSVPKQLRSDLLVLANVLEVVPCDKLQDIGI
jgi:hypothetical protein